MLRNKKIFLLLLFLTMTPHAHTVYINFHNLSLYDFTQIVGKITQINILLDKNNMQNTVNYHSPHAGIESSELIPLLRFFLQKEGLMLVDKGAFYQVSKIDFSQKILNLNNLIIKSDFSNTTETIKAIPLISTLKTHTKKRISKETIKPYVQDTDFLWKDIALSSYKENNRTKGFKIVYFKKDSDFANLGLKRGDIILYINEKEMTSYIKISSFFTKILNTDNIRLYIKRNNKYIKLEYEIY